MSSSSKDISSSGTGAANGNNDNEKPKLIVFDLDFTLWPFWLGTNIYPPFAMEGSNVVDSHGQTIKHFPDVPEVLEHIQSLGISMAIASRTTEFDDANTLLRLFGWDKYFKQREIYPDSGHKFEHFSKIKEAFGFPYTSMMFFDDEQGNIDDLSKEGVHSVRVEKGVTMKLLKDALQNFPNK